MLFGGGFEDIELFDGGDKGFFGKYVEAVLEQILCNIVMKKARRGVDDEVDIFSAQDVANAFKRLAFSF